MKNAPTLADSVIREWLKPFMARYGDSAWMLRNLSESRKFVLDKDMSAFLADLAFASISDNVGGNRRSIILDSMRRQARLPHRITWIEYDFIARATRAVEAYDAFMDLTPGQMPDRCGWLCIQHPQLETAFMAIECNSHTWVASKIKGNKISGSTAKLKRIEQPGTSMVAYTWRTDDGPPPWSNADINQYFDIMGKVTWTDHEKPIEDLPKSITPEAAVTGIVEYKSESVKVVKSPTVKLEVLQQLWKNDQMFNPLKELAGDLRYLWAFLSTLNDLPVSLTDVRASKGFVARGRYRKFVDHKIIHLHIPEKRYKRVAAQAIAIARRRAHPVRGHFRIDRHKPPSPMCDHEWGPADDHGHLTCNICHGRKLYIHEHMRGDASLGIVTHDYVVEHEPI